MAHSLDFMIKTKLKDFKKQLENNHALEIIIDLLRMKGIIIQIGFEVEFYCLKSYDPSNIIKEFLIFLSLNIKQKNNNTMHIEKEVNETIMHLKKEKEDFQYEIIINPFTDILKGILIFNMLKKFLYQKKEIILSPKPYAKKEGSSVQISFSIHNIKLENIGTKEVLMQFSCLLCEYLGQMLLVFLKSKDDIARLTPGFMVPTHICFGIDNRFSMIRLVKILANNYSDLKKINNNLHNLNYSALNLKDSSLNLKYTSINNIYIKKNPNNIIYNLPNYNNNHSLKSQTEVYRLEHRLLNVNTDIYTIIYIVFTLFYKNKDQILDKTLFLYKNKQKTLLQNNKNLQNKNCNLKTMNLGFIDDYLIFGNPNTAIFSNQFELICTDLELIYQRFNPNIFLL